MNFALFLLLPASAATDMTPPPAPPAGVRTYNAILATGDAPAANDLAKPAVFIEDGSAKAVIFQSGTGWIV
jgi:hypothetical protein